MEQVMAFLIRIFPGLLRMSLSAGVLALVAALLRLLLRKAPKWACCLLWALVAVRLLCPSLPEARVSLMPERALRSVSETQLGDARDAVLPAIDYVTPKDREANLADGNDHNVRVGHSAAPGAYLPLVWALGVLAMLLYALASYLRLRRQTAASVAAGEGVYLCDGIGSPFILGLLRPRIFVPSRLGEPQLSHVLAHERAHLRRRDHWWKPLGYLLLSFHWFNPALWLAYVLLCRDIELACDERVVRDLDGEARADYSQALLDLSRPRRSLAACPLAFGEVGVKRRVKDVLNYRKPGFWIVLGAVLVCAAAAVFFLTDPKAEFAPAGGVAAAHWQQGTWAASLAPEAGEELAALTDRYGSRRFPAEKNVIDELSRTVTLLYGSGEKLVVHEQYYSGFSLRKGREDDCRTIVTWYDGEGRTVKTRRMSDRFDDALVQWKLRRTENGDYTVLSDVPSYPPPTAETLRERFPEYFGLPASKGLELYVWQLAPNVWYSGLMAGTDRNRTGEELMGLKPAAVREMRAILATYDVPEESILIIPISQPYSSYSCVLDEGAARQARELFFGEPDPADAPLFTVSCGDQTAVPWLHFRWAETWSERGTLVADGIPLEVDLREHEDRVPAIVLTGELTTALREGVTGASDLQIYDMELNRLIPYGGEDLNAVYALPPGEYWCSFRITEKEKFIPEEEKYERSGYDAVIRLVVPEQQPPEQQPRTLEERFPEYFGLSAFKGLELYVWQMAPGSWLCGLMEGTNRNKTFKELMDLDPANVEEMKEILASYDVPEENIFVIPINHPLSSYAYPIDEALEKEARDLFFGEAAARDAPRLTVSCAGHTVTPFFRHRWAETWSEEYGWINADGIPIEAEITDHEGQIPPLVFNGALSLRLREGVARSGPRLQVYDRDFNRLVYYNEEDLEPLETLAPGEYWCTFCVTEKGKYVPEDERYERFGWEAVIRLIVPEE